MQNRNQPATFADIRLITGEQGSGKSNTLTAFPVDDYYGKLTGIMSLSGNVIKAKAINNDDKKFLRQNGITPNKLKYVRIFSDDEKQSKIIKIPDDYIVVSPVHIFSNFPLFGIRYALITIEEVIQYINTELFNDAWILYDESVMTDARNSMEGVGKLMAFFGGQIRKRRAKFCLAAQYNEMIERRYRLFATTRITCSYDEYSQYITLEIKKRNEPAFTIGYYATNYWWYFKTDKLVEIPQVKIDNTLAKYRARAK